MWTLVLWRCERRSRLMNRQSIKCSLCGKIFKNTALANYHAEKSGHDQFEESTEEVRLLLLVYVPYKC